jgi:hypothetical protein
MGKTSKKSAKVAKEASAKRAVEKPPLLAGGNPQIAKGDGDALVQAYIAAMPGWKHDVGHRLDALIARAVPNVRKAVRWNTLFYGIDGQGWFLGFHCLTKYVKVFFLLRHVAATRSARRVQAKGRALPRYPRGRPARRSSIRRLGEASQSIAGQTNVSGKSRSRGACVARAKAPRRCLRLKLLSTLADKSFYSGRIFRSAEKSRSFCR